MTDELRKLVKVKPLDWADYPGESWVDQYQIEQRGTVWLAYWYTGLESFDHILWQDKYRAFPSIDAAKQAVQSHHETHIFAYLEPAA